MADVQGVTVHIPGALLERTGSRRQVVVTARTVRGVIDELERAHPGLKFNICHETGELRRFVNIFLEGEEVRYLQGLDTPTRPGETVHIIHSVAGG